MKNIYILLFVMWSGQSCQLKQKAEVTVEMQSPDSLEPTYHFTPPSNWMNDPNGMVYYAGEYHLFYQHFPDKNEWGPMHWGHAVSRDMLHWVHLPIALYPDSLGFIFSGSAVIDHQNTTGFGTLDNPPMVAIYTYSNQQEEFKGSITFQNQAIAYSLDKGRSWTKYEGNPVVINPGIKDFRDPKVTWMEDFQKWVMILAVKDHVSIYSSKDLKSWTHESDFGVDKGAHGGVWECPDLFNIKDDLGNPRWVMLVSINPGGIQGGSGTQYFVGEFDGKHFTTTQEDTKWIDYGADNYAGVLWSNIQDGRKLFLGWMSNWAYANKVSQVNRRNMMTLPREIYLLENNGNPVLAMNPVRELVSMEGEIQMWSSEELRDGRQISSAFHLSAEFAEGTSAPFDLIFTASNGDTLVISHSPDEMTIDRTRCGDVSLSPIFSQKHTSTISELYDFDIYVDRSSIEVFVNNGKVIFTDLFFTDSPLSSVQLIESTPQINISFEYRQINHPI